MTKNGRSRNVMKMRIQPGYGFLAADFQNVAVLFSVGKLNYLQPSSTMQYLNGTGK